MTCGGERGKRETRVRLMALVGMPPQCHRESMAASAQDHPLLALEAE